MAITFTSAGSFNGFGGITLSNPTSLQFGPDGKLYVAEQNGSINSFTIGIDANGNYIATSGQELLLANGGGVVKSIMNHNDNGSLNPTLGERQVTGMLVTGTALNPVLYISSSDPRIASNGEIDLDTNSGIVSRVTWNGTNWVAVDILRGLPRSEENHANNGMVLSADGTKLYLAVGGNTNNGAPSSFFSYTAEYALSGTVLEIDLTAINSLPILTDSDGSQINGAAASRQYIYDLPTLDDPNVLNVTGGVGENAAGLDENGPFGGNDGLNMAILPADAPLRIYADGFRNHYDLVLRADGKLYTVDNGSNSGLGGDPLIVGGEAVNTPVNGGVGDPEPLFLVQDGQYYGHPNPTRANQNQSWTVYNNSGTPDTSITVNTVPDISALVPNSVNIADGFLIDPSKFSGNAARLAQSGVRIPFDSTLSPSLVELGSSSNGLVEYASNAYGGALNGAFLVAQFNNTITLLNVNDAGTGLEPLIDPGLDGILGTTDDSVADADGVYTLISGLATPLDVTTGPNGSIWVAEIGGSSIKVYKPGVTASITDIDNDGILNVFDPFSRDASNGTSVTLSPGQTLVWDFDPNQDNNRPGPVGFATGLTGVMINGTTDPEVFFNSASTLPGQNIKLDNVKFATAAGGGTTVVEYVSNGDALGDVNNGEYLFQTGFKLAPTIDTFTIKWSVVNPLLSGSNQQIGGYIGTGDQSNYLKIVATANPAGEIQILLENNNAIVTQTFLQADDLFSVPVDKQIFFELEINPGVGTATPKITYETAATNKVVNGSPIDLGGTGVLNAILGNNKVQGQTTGLAVGLYSSNTGQPAAPSGSSFQALFGDITITGTGTNSSILYRVNAGGPTIAATDGGLDWITDTLFLLDPGSNDVSSFSAVNPGLTVPSTTSGTIFDTERWDAAGGTEMQYGFSVPSGIYEVRLYMGNGYSGTATAGLRVFDVALEGQVKPNLNDIDLTAKFGHLVGGMISNTVQVTDGTLNIQFLHDTTENPLVNGIEIIKLSELNSVPTISIVGGPYSVSEADGQVQISLLSNAIVPSSQAVTVNYEIVPGTATPQTDYSHSGFFLPETAKYTGTATIAGGSADATFLVNIPQDTLVEGNETFTVNITSVSTNALIGSGSTTVTIVDDDLPPSSNNVVVAINSGGPSLIQNGINFVADTAFLNGGTYTDGADQPIFNGTIYQTERNAGTELGSFNYSIPVADGNYTVELHFAEIFQTTPGSRVFDVSVEGQLVLDNFDILAQNGGNINQPVIFTVPNTVSPNTFGSMNAIDIGFTTSADQAKVSGIVIRSATALANTVNIAATAQAGEPSTNGLFTVSLSQVATTNTVVNYSVTGTATAGSDYTALNGSVTILANQLSATIPITVIDNITPESTESVIITLTGVTGASGVVLGSTTTATVNIADNDVPVNVTIAATSQAGEPSTNGLFTVSLSQVATTNTVVNYSVTGTATAGSDYTALNGSVTILANQLSATIPITVIDNITPESTESVIITLTGVTGASGVVLGSTTTATVNITDNDGIVGQATLKVNLNDNNVQVSNFNDNSFQITNTGGKTITQVVIDVSSALYPDSVFDPFGLAGDSGFKPLTINTNGGTGVVTPSSASYIGTGGTSGYRSLLLTFNPSVSGGFNPGETVGFSIDMDPNSVVGTAKDPLDAGSSPFWDVGGVSGAELIGSTFTVTFTDGTTATGQLQGAGNQGGSQGVASQNSLNLPVSLIVNGLSAGNVGTYSSNGPTVIVNGPAGSTARVVLTKGFIQPVTPYAQFLADQLAVLATKEFPVNNAVEFQTVDIVLTGGNQDISGLFNFSGVANYNFAGEGQLPLGFVASVIDPANGNLPIGPVTQPIYLKFADLPNQVNVTIAATSQAGEPSTNGLFTVSLSQVATTNTVVNYSVTGTATAGSDYTALNGSVTILANQLSATIPITVIDNITPESTESVIITLTGVTGASGVVLGSTTTATVNIADNDVPVNVTIAATAQAGEPSTNGLFTVSLSQVATTNTVVNYSVTGTATAGSDYTALNGSVTILANQLSATIPITVIDNITPESTESVIITLTGVTGASGVVLGSTTTATVNITDNDVPVSNTITIQAESITTLSGYRLESNGVASGGSMLSLVGGGSSETGSATFAFTGTTGNYNVILGTFDENDGSATISVSKNGTSIGSVLLNQNLGSALANATTKVEKTVANGVSIVNGELITVTGVENSAEHARFDFIRFEAVGPAVPSVTIAATTQASEPNVNGLFTVSLSQVATANTIVTYSVAGTALSAGTDYSALSGTVTILAGQLTASIPVVVTDDLAPESAETVIVTLTGASGSNAVLGNTKTATVTIIDNDVLLTPIILQAEAATNIVNYRSENIGAASGGQVLSFVGGSSNETGSATFGFNEAAGTYNIIIGTFDENDGLASFSVQLNDFETITTTTIGTLNLTSNLGSPLANSQTFVSPTVAFGVALTPGDSIKINGFENSSEHARLDYIQLNRVL